MQAMVVNVSLAVGVNDTVVVVLRLEARKRSKVKIAESIILPLCGVVVIGHLFHRRKKMRKNLIHC